MSNLPNIRHERFCQLRAKGYSLEEAYEMAGFTRDSSHASRLARRPTISARIAELRLDIGQDAYRANLEQTIAGLLRLAERADYQNSPQHLTEARVTLMEAHRLYDIWMENRAKEREMHAKPRTNPANYRPADRPSTGQKPAISGHCGEGRSG